MTKREKQLILLNHLLHELPTLKKSRLIQQANERELKLANLNMLLPGLISIYNRELQSAQKNAAGFYSKNRRLLSPTTFEVMRRRKLEETHSNVIAYLLGKVMGKELLISLVKKVDQDSKSKTRKFNKNFKVVREKEIKGKRVDIWIEAKDFLVIIENKFNAKLHMVGEDITQADFYRDEISEKDRKKNPIFILLDQKGTEYCRGYKTLDYTDLLESLLSVDKYFENDFIFTEYIHLLLRLLNKLDRISGDGMIKVKYLANINYLNEVLSNGTKESYTRV